MPKFGASARVDAEKLAHSPGTKNIFDRACSETRANPQDRPPKHHRRGWGFLRCGLDVGALFVQGMALQTTWSEYRLEGFVPLLRDDFLHGKVYGEGNISRIEPKEGMKGGRAQYIVNSPMLSHAASAF